MRTRDKIITASIELFNEHGERNITTNHIASHLGISPGNLYYHFRNKEDIIRNIFDLYKAKLENSFIPAEYSHDPVALLHHTLDSVFELQWRFSFFYANLPDILARDEQLQNAYHEVQAAQVSTMKATVTELKVKGVLTIDDEDVPDLVNSLKINTIFWITYLKTLNPNTKIEKAMIYQGVLTVIAMLKPYVQGEREKERILALRKHYVMLAETKEQ